MLTRPAPAFRRLAIAAAVITYLLIIMGGIVRVTGSGLGCADSWPSCNGALLPALNGHAIIEFLHRSITVLTGAAIVALTASAWLWQRAHRRLVVGASVAAFLYVLQAALGALVVKYELPGGVVMIHLANALLLLAALVYVALQANTIGTGRERVLRRAAPQAAVAAAATYLLALSGAFVVENGAGASCDGWPLCGGGFQLPSGELAVINAVHRIVVLLVVVLLGVTMTVVLRRHPGDRGLRRAALAVGVIVILQIAAGALVVVLGLPAALRALHLSLASALWATVFIIAVLTRLPATAIAADTETGVRGEALRRRAGVAAS